MIEKCNSNDCNDCEAMRILLRLQFNLRKNRKHSSIEDFNQALDAAIRDSLYVPSD